MKTKQREAYGSDDAPAGLIPEVSMIGWDRFRSAADSRLGAHQHANAYEICLLVSGTVDWWVAKERHSLHRGDVYVTRPGELHGGAHAVMQPCELYWVQIVPQPLPDELQEALRQLPRRFFSGVELLPTYYESLLAEHRNHASWSEIAARAALHSLIITVVRDARQKRSESEADIPSSVVADAVWLLEEDHNVEQVALRIGVSAPRLVERFQEEMGTTPGEWRTLRRLEAAKAALLAEPDLPITEIAFRFGWASSQYFATTFKRHIGLSPSQWRQATLTAAEGE